MYDHIATAMSVRPSENQSYDSYLNDTGRIMTTSGCVSITDFWVDDQVSEWLGELNSIGTIFCDIGWRLG